MLNGPQPRDGRDGQERRDGLAAVFAPRRVALVGASDRPGSVGRLLWDNLAGFPGEVLPVGPAGTGLAAGRPIPAWNTSPATWTWPGGHARRHRPGHRPGPPPPRASPP